MIRSSTAFTLRPRDHNYEDKIFTAVKHWKLYALSKAFNTWKQHLFHAEKTLPPIPIVAITADNEASPPMLESVAVGEATEKPESGIQESHMDQQPPKEDGEGKETKESEKKPTRRSRRRDLSKELGLGTEFSRKYAVSAPQKSRTLIPGQTGLRNLGNTCFMNAVLQALSNVIDFRQYFILEFQPVDKRGKLWRRNTIDCLQLIHAQLPTTKEISMSLELHNLLRVVWSGKWAVVTPYALLDALWRFVPRFRNYQQQDAQEFLVFLLDRLHEELKLKGVGQIPRIPKGDDSTIISKIFQGKLRSEVICGKCGRASPTFENFLDLQLDIPVQHPCQPARGRKKIAVPSCQLEECLESFTQSEDLGADAYFCEHCGSKQSAAKRLSIERLPNVVCIVLKRFCWTEYARAKIDTQVEFPLSGLDLAQYSTRKEQEEAESNEMCYSLKAVVSHHGTGIQRGHYTSFCFNSERQSWLHFNDSRVSVVSAEEVQQQQAYILFYEKESE